MENGTQVKPVLLTAIIFAVRCFVKRLCLQVKTKRLNSSRHCLKPVNAGQTLSVFQRFTINYPPNTFKKAAFIHTIQQKHKIGT